MRAASTIAATFTNHYVNAHPGTNALSGGALTHGFAITFYVLAGLAVAGAVLGALLIESKPRAPEAARAEGELAYESMAA